MQTLQFIKSVVEKVQSSLLLVSMAPPLLGHMTSCLLECEVCPAGREHIRRIGLYTYLPYSVSIFHTCSGCGLILYMYMYMQ